MVLTNVNKSTAGMRYECTKLLSRFPLKANYIPFTNSFRVTDEKYLQWQCKKTCDLCNVDPSRKEMDQMCDAVIPQSVKQKYIRQPKNNKIKSSKNKGTKPLNRNEITKVQEKDKSSGSRTVTIEYLDKSKNIIVSKTQNQSPPRKSSAIEYFDKKENKVLQKTQKSSSRKKSALPFTSLSVDKSSRVSSKSEKASSLKNTYEPSFPKKSKSTLKKKNTSTTPKKSSGGFIVINDPERRRKLRSFWMRAG